MAVSAEALSAVMRAAGRTAAVAHVEMKRDIDRLATVAALAPLLGMFGTIASIPGAFSGCGGEKSACMAAMVLGLTESLWPTAIGFLVGLPALWFYRYLAERAEHARNEMRAATLELLNQLAGYRGRWTLGSVSATGEFADFGGLESRRGIEARLAALLRRWGLRRVLPLGQALLTGILVVMDYLLLGFAGGEFDGFPYFPIAGLVAEALSAPAVVLARCVHYLLGYDAGSLMVFVTAQPVSVLVWYVAGAWLDGRIGPGMLRRFSRVVRWALVLLTLVLYFLAFVDAVGFCLMGSFWGPIVGLSRWIWLSVLLHAQMSALRVDDGSHLSVLGLS